MCLYCSLFLLSPDHFTVCEQIERNGRMSWAVTVYVCVSWWVVQCGSACVCTLFHWNSVKWSARASEYKFNEMCGAVAVVVVVVVVLCTYVCAVCCLIFSVCVFCSLFLICCSSLAVDSFIHHAALIQLHRFFSTFLFRPILFVRLFASHCLCVCAYVRLMFAFDNSRKVTPSCV